MARFYDYMRHYFTTAQKAGSLPQTIIDLPPTTVDLPQTATTLDTDAPSSAEKQTMDTSDDSGQKWETGRVIFAPITSRPSVRPSQEQKNAKSTKYKWNVFLLTEN